MLYIKYLKYDLIGQQPILPLEVQYIIQVCHFIFQYFYIFMIIQRLNKKYPHQNSKTILFATKHHVKSMESSKPPIYKKKIFIKDENVSYKTQSNNILIASNQQKYFQIQDQNNSVLANQFLIEHQAQKFNKNQKKVTQDTIFKLMNAYSIHKPQIIQSRTYSTQTEQKQNSKVCINKKIKMIKKQFTSKNQRQTLKFKVFRKNMFFKRKNGNLFKDEESSSSVQDQFHQNYSLYRDQEIFPPLCSQFTSMTVTHRLDNDIDSDDQQVQRAVRKMTIFLSDSIKTSKFEQMMKKQHQQFMNQEQSQ